MTLARGSVVPGRGVAQSGHWLAARLIGNAGNPITRGLINAISYKVTNLDTGDVGGTGTLAVNAVVYDTLQTADPRWDVDTVGYNFAFVCPASAFPKGGRVRVDVKFTPFTGEQFVVPFEFPVLPVYM